MKHRYPLVDGHGNVVQDLQNQTSKILARLFELQKFFWHRKEPEESDLAFLSSVRTEAFFVAWKQVFLGLPCDIFFSGDALPVPIRCWATGLKLLIGMGFSWKWN